MSPTRARNRCTGFAFILTLLWCILLRARRREKVPPIVLKFQREMVQTGDPEDCRVILEGQVEEKKAKLLFSSLGRRSPTPRGLMRLGEHPDCGPRWGGAWGRPAAAPQFPVQVSQLARMCCRSRRMLMDMRFYFLFLVGLRRWLKALAEARAAVVLGAVRSHKTTGVFRVVKGSEPSGCTVGKNFFFSNASQALSSSKNERPKIHSLTQTISPG